MDPNAERESGPFFIQYFDFVIETTQQKVGKIHIHQSKKRLYKCDISGSFPTVWLAS